MQQIITAKLKLLAAPEQQQVLRQTQLAYRDALNYVSRYAFEQGKLSNAERLQQGIYRHIRAHFHLPAQMACNVPRQVQGTLDEAQAEPRPSQGGTHEETVQRVGSAAEVYLPDADLQLQLRLQLQERATGERPHPVRADCASLPGL